MKYVKQIIFFLILGILIPSWANDTEDDEKPNKLKRSATRLLRDSFNGSVKSTVPFDLEDEGSQVLKKVCSQSVRGDEDDPQITPPVVLERLWGNNEPITLFRPDHIKLLLLYFSPLDRARLRGVCRAFRYCVDCLEYSGAFRGQIKAESLRKMFRAQVSFGPGNWQNSLTSSFLPLIEYVIPGFFEDEKYIPFSQVVPKSDDIISLCEGRKCFELIPGSHFVFTFIGLCAREGFYTCRHTEYIGKIRRAVHFELPLELISHEVDTVHLVFTTNQGVISCEPIVFTKDQKRP